MLLSSVASHAVQHLMLYNIKNTREGKRILCHHSRHHHYHYVRAYVMITQHL